ncbi:ABC transporter ATP-binding protein [Nonomuraea sp. K274]|uniref:ABC transporter ATP-binding protein n=1 Tax=Nonomuraea cypriaca TaxID=1187855 RepID=A0A931AHX4_9ACTN|nr:ABC transporter ATP-binding protein [Nonomuraea cypriaca]MBF8190634.1 ABC transporter ATP-binding protein [Nonomuraea cypriaca]
MTGPVLEVTNLVKHFPAGGRGTVHAVNDVSFTIGQGEVLGLVGESGSGKSTVGRAIMRLVDPTAGSIKLLGTDITTLSRARMRPLRRQMHMVFQDPYSSLNPRIPIGEIVAEPLRQHRWGDRRQIDRRVAEVFDQCGLRTELRHRFPHELSGGQRQRVGIARALSVNPKLLIADEPTSALDVSVRAAIINLLMDLQRDLGFSCLFITHDLSAVRFIADRIAVMYVGRLVEIGAGRDIFADPKMPYTQALLSAAPLPNPRRQRRRERILLGGELPSATRLPPGCAFHTRCPIAVGECRTEQPELVSYPGGESAHAAACRLIAQDGTAPHVARGSNRPGPRTFPLSTT